MTEPDDYAITSAMIAAGGSFVRALGQAWRYGDADNKARIKAAFPEYWRKYAALAAAEPVHPDRAL